MHEKELCEVMRHVHSGWPDSCYKSSPLYPYHIKHTELTISHGGLFWNIRVIIPTSLRINLLNALHESHMGIVRMKSLARSYIWWPGIDADIERIAKSCSSCSQSKPANAHAPVMSWPYAQRPWQCIHMNFCGPLYNLYWLVIVESFSKWPEIFCFTKVPDTGTMLTKLKFLFASMGLPEECVSDNGPQFTLEEFKHFLQMNGIAQKLPVPYCPATNELAERTVRTFKQSMHAATSVDLATALAAFLLLY